MQDLVMSQGWAKYLLKDFTVSSFMFIWISLVSTVKSEFWYKIAILVCVRVVILQYLFCGKKWVFKCIYDFRFIQIVCVFFLKHLKYNIE